MSEQNVPNTHGDVIPILMPQLGQAVEEGLIVGWLVKPGDRIEKGQVIFELETDKAVVEVEAEHCGRLARIVVGVEEFVPVRTPIAYLAESDEILDAWLAAEAANKNTTSTEIEVASTEQKTESSTASAPDVSRSARAEDRIKASPAARQLAESNGINLDTLAPGSGPDGRVLVADVQAVLTGKRLAQPEAPVRQTLSRMRRSIARNMSLSKQTIPHFYVKATVKAEPALRFCEARKSRFRCGLNDLIVAACARTMREFPAFRSRIENEEIVTFPRANVGIAVSVEDGLLVPVLRSADDMSLERLAGEARRLIKAARQGKVEAPGEATFTVSNLGMFGAEEFSAIINPGEAAILAVGAVREAVVVEKDAIQTTRTITLTLSCDHRLIDGVLAAKFLRRLKEQLENPEGLE